MLRIGKVYKLAGSDGMSRDHYFTVTDVYKRHDGTTMVIAENPAGRQEWEHDLAPFGEHDKERKPDPPKPVKETAVPLTTDLPRYTPPPATVLTTPLRPPPKSVDKPASKTAQEQAWDKIAPCPEDF